MQGFLNCGALLESYYKCVGNHYLVLKLSLFNTVLLCLLCGKEIVGRQELEACNTSSQRFHRRLCQVQFP